MTTWNGNDAFLSIDGYDISGYYTKADFEEVVGVEDVSAGAGLEHEILAPKLYATNFNATIAYDITAVSTHVAKLKPGIHAVVWGPEGNATGKPKQTQSILISSAKHSSVEVGKPMVVWELKGRGAAAPTEGIFDGDTF